MSRRSDKDDTKRRRLVNDAISYAIGLLTFFNDGSKRGMIKYKLQSAKFNDDVISEALHILVAQNIIKSKVCYEVERHIDYELHPSLKELPFDKFLEKLDDIRRQKIEMHPSPVTRLRSTHNSYTVVTTEVPERRPLRRTNAGIFRYQGTSTPPTPRNSPTSERPIVPRIYPELPPPYKP